MKIIARSLALAFAASTSLFSTGASAAPATVSTTTYHETPAWADSFVDSVGVDSRYGDHDTPALVTQWLEWSGIRHLRDSAPASRLLISIYGALGKHGIKHSIGLGRGFATSGLVADLKAYAPYVDYVEPANEADNFSNPNWSQMRSDQVRIWNTVRGNKAWNSVAVVGPSFANPAAHAAHVGPLDSYEDFGQMHDAQCNWNPGVTDPAPVSIQASIDVVRISTVYKPIITTETGYNDNPVRGCSISDSIIAKYTTRTVSERWLAGLPRVYFDTLADHLSDPVFGNLGLLHQDGSPKVQMLALGNLNHLLADPGTAPKPSSVSYTIFGAPPDVHHVLLARRDGTYDLLLYRELPCWDHYGKTAIVVPSKNVYLGIMGLKNATLYSYNASYSFNSQRLGIRSNYTTENFPVTDSISVVHFGF